MVKKALESLNAWVFAEDSGESLAVFRMLAGGLSFASLLLGLPFLEDWYSEKGLWPSALMSEWHASHGGMSLLWGSTDPLAAWAVYLGAMAASLMLCLGLFTRASAIACFVLVVSLHHRSPDILNSGDTLLRQWLFICAVGPAGAAWSLDRARQSAKGAPAPVISSWPLRLVQFQLAVLYFTTVWHKWGGDLWRNGTATYYTSELREFHRFPMPPFWSGQPWVGIETYGTLIIELALATLVFHPKLRGWVLLSGLLLHAGIEYSMNIPLFAFIICTGYVAFYQGGEVKGFFDRIRRKPQGAGLEQAG